MKRLIFFSLLICGSLLVDSCRKNSVTEEFTPIVDPVLPDFVNRVQSSVAGFITDENGVAIDGAVIRAGTITVSSNAYGYFRISSGSFAKSAGFIEADVPGYFKGIKTFIPVAGKESFVRLQLVRKESIGSFNAGNGGSVSSSSGLSISFPQNALVKQSDNAPYSGTANVAAHWFDPSDMNLLQKTMPGDLRGVDSAGHLKILTTFGMIGVELTGSSGELLKVAAGSKAVVNFPIPASLTASAPATVPLWHFDEDKGLWIQEGNVARVSNYFTGEVSHFSFWNVDVPTSLVNFSVQLIDNALQPLAHTGVSIGIAGVPNSAITAFTDDSGRVDGMVPANESLEMKVMTPCNSNAYSQPISTTNSDVHLGSVIIDAGQYAVTISGTANKCNGQPVTNGLVILTGGSENKILPIQNGLFKGAGISCPNSNVAVFVIDNETSMSSTVQHFVLVTGANDFGTISACTAASPEEVTYTLDGSPTTLSLPLHMFTGNYILSTSSTQIDALNLVSGELFRMTFEGPDGLGSHFVPAGGIISLPSGNYTVENTPMEVNITSYGLIGQDITGTCGATIKAADNSLHSFSCTFNVRRDQ